MDKKFYTALTSLPYQFSIPPDRDVSALLNKAIGSQTYLGDIIKINPDDGKETELWESYQAFCSYRDEPSLDNEVEMILELGDVYSQRALSDGRCCIIDYDLDINKASHKITNAIIHFCLEVEDSLGYKFKDEEVMALNSMKMIIRESLKSKNKELEHHIAKELLLKMRSI